MVMAAPPILTGQKPGNLVVCGDSLTQPFPSELTSAAWWNQLSIPYKTYPPVNRSGFGWGFDNLNTPSSLNIINAAYDASAPWNVIICWAGTNDVVLGTPTDTIYAKAVTFAGNIDPRYHLALVTSIPRQSVDFTSWNNKLKTQPYVGTGTVAGTFLCDLTPLNGNPLVSTDTTYYQTDHIHLTRLGETTVALSTTASISKSLNAYLATLP